MPTVTGRWREPHRPPKLPLSWADVDGGEKGATAVDAENRVVARIDRKADVYILTVDGWIWRVWADKGTARLNAILASDPDPRDKTFIEKPVKEFTDMATAKAEAEFIADTFWPS